MLDHTYTLLLEVRDVPGVLVRVAQVFARRGCNISSIHVEHPAAEPWSHMQIRVKNIARIDQITGQLEKLVDVHRVTVHEITKTTEVTEATKAAKETSDA